MSMRLWRIRYDLVGGCLVIERGGLAYFQDNSRSLLDFFQEAPVLETGLVDG